MGSSMDFLDIPTTVWNISMMSIYVVLSTSANLLTNSSTCFSIISTMLIYVLYRSSMYFWIVLIRDLDTYLRRWSTYFFVLLRTCKLYLYVILEHIYDVYLCNSMVLLRAFSFLLLLRDSGAYVSKMLIYVLLLFFYVLYNISFYVILEHIYVLLPTWKFVLLRTFEK